MFSISADGAPAAVAILGWMNTWETEAQRDPFGPLLTL